MEVLYQLSEEGAAARTRRPQGSSSIDEKHGDLEVLARRAPESGVGGEQRYGLGGEGLGERDVGRVVRGEVRAELPNAGSDDIVRVALDGDIEEVRDGLVAAPRGGVA